jgi:hypothetical protein
MSVAIDDRGAGVDMPCVVGDFPEPLGPIVAAPGEYGDCRALDMDLHAITIKLYFVKPARAAWHLGDRRRQRWFNEPGIFGLDTRRVASHGSREPHRLRSTCRFRGAQ